MIQYIDKSALVANIIRKLVGLLVRMRKVYFSSTYKEWKAMAEAYEDILSFIKTLEVKEVDLEKEYKDFVENDPVYSKLVDNIVGKAIVKHFFELGLNCK